MTLCTYLRVPCACNEVKCCCRLCPLHTWLFSVQTSQEAKLNHSHLCYQDTPKRISFPSDCKILGLTVHRYGVFAVVSSGNTLRVGRVDMLTGKVSDGGKFPDTQAQHFAKQQSCTLYKLVCSYTRILKISFKNFKGLRNVQKSIETSDLQIFNTLVCLRFR